jgi:hypothetical protein
LKPDRARRALTPQRGPVVAAIDVDTLTDDELTDDELTDAVVELNRLHHALLAAEARIERAVAVRRVYAADDAKSARVWITHKTREPKAAVAPACGWPPPSRRCR